MTPRRFPFLLVHLSLLSLLPVTGVTAAGSAESSGANPPTQGDPVVDLPPVVVREDRLPKVLTSEVLDSLYHPFTGDKIELAPDGKHIAFSLHEGDKIFLRIVDVDHPDNVRSISVNVDATPVRGEDTAKTPARVRDLKWIDSRRILFATTPFEIMAMDADGQNGRAVIDEKIMSKGQAAHLIALPEGDPDHIIVQAFRPPSLDTDRWILGYRVDHRTQKLEQFWAELKRRNEIVLLLKEEHLN